MKRSYLILNLTDMNDLPAPDRWLFKEHEIDTVSVNGSILSGYATYRALPIPRGGEQYGAYNWRMTVRNPENSEKRADWSPQANPNAHSPAFVFTNRRIDDEIKGGGNTTVNDGPFFWFVIALKYPDGVSQADGERWFYDSFIPAMKNQPDLLRGFSYKGIEPHVTPFIRIVELWYRDSNAWIRNWVDGKPNIKAPSWATYRQNGLYLEPYKDVVCIFLEESPERDFLKQGTAYYTDN